MWSNSRQDKTKFSLCLILALCCLMTLYLGAALAKGPGDCKTKDCPYCLCSGKICTQDGVRCEECGKEGTCITHLVKRLPGFWASCECENAECEGSCFATCYGTAITPDSFTVPGTLCYELDWSQPHELWVIPSCGMDSQYVIMYSLNFTLEIESYNPDTQYAISEFIHFYAVLDSFDTPLGYTGLNILYLDSTTEYFSGGLIDLYTGEITLGSFHGILTNDLFTQGLATALHGTIDFETGEADFATASSGRKTESAPTLTQWGLVVFAGLFILSLIFMLRRRRAKFPLGP